MRCNQTPPGRLYWLSLPFHRRARPILFFRFTRPLFPRPLSSELFRPRRTLSLLYHSLLCDYLRRFHLVLSYGRLSDDPGEITRENVNSCLALFPYDNVLYHPKVCRTLQIAVVARSHCEIPISLRMYRFFLLFLICNGIAAAYYAFGCRQQMNWRLSTLKVKWTDSVWRNWIMRRTIAVKFDPCDLACDRRCILNDLAPPASVPPGEERDSGRDGEDC